MEFRAASQGCLLLLFDANSRTGIRSAGCLPLSGTVQATWVKQKGKRWRAMEMKRNRWYCSSDRCHACGMKCLRHFILNISCEFCHWWIVIHCHSGTKKDGRLLFNMYKQTVMQDRAKLRWTSVLLIQKRMYSSSMSFPKEQHTCLYAVYLSLILHCTYCAVQVSEQTSDGNNPRMKRSYWINTERFFLQLLGHLIPFNYTSLGGGDQIPCTLCDFQREIFWN